MAKLNTGALQDIRFVSVVTSQEGCAKGKIRVRVLAEVSGTTKVRGVLFTGTLNLLVDEGEWFGINSNEELDRYILVQTGLAPEEEKQEDIVPTQVTEQMIAAGLGR